MIRSHANAKLGLAGRRELVAAIESGMPLKRAAARSGVAGDRAPLVAPPVGRRSYGLGARRSFFASTPPAAPALADRGGADPARPAAHQPRPRSSGRDCATGPLDDLEGALAARALAPAAPAASKLPPLRVVAAGRAAAHRRQEARPLQRPRPPRHRRPLDQGPAPRHRLRPPPLRRRRGPPHFGGQRLVRRLPSLSFFRSRPATGSRAWSAV